MAENSRISVSRCQGHFKKLSVETAVMEGKKKKQSFKGKACVTGFMVGEQAEALRDRAPLKGQGAAWVTHHRPLCCSFWLLLLLCPPS